MRAMWKGVVRVGRSITVPVKLYAAVQDRGVHFRLLSRKSQRPVQQQMVNPVTGEPVETSSIVRGFETEDGVFVVLEEGELKELEPPPSRDIEIARFVPAGAIDHPWYDRPYWLGPDQKEDDYFALVEALRRDEREGVAHWTMRRQAYAGALRAEGDHLMLVTLRSAGEVIAPSALPVSSGRKLDERELRMARQLIGALEGDFDIAAYTDEYRERLLELVQAKAEGRRIRLPKAEAKREPESLRRALEASLDAVRKERGRAA